MTPKVAAEIVEGFAERYVDRWERIHGPSDSVKAQGWAILQAAAWLREVPEVDSTAGSTK